MTTAISRKSHEINVTPFIDVILVLFDPSSWWRPPLSTVDLPIDLPTSTRETRRKKPDKPTYVQHQARSRGRDRGETLVQAGSIWWRSLDAMADASTRTVFIFLRARPRRAPMAS